MITDQEKANISMNLIYLQNNPDFIKWLRLPKVYFKYPPDPVIDPKPKQEVIMFKPYESKKILTKKEQEALEKREKMELRLHEKRELESQKILGGNTEAGRSNSEEQKSSLG